MNNTLNFQVLLLPSWSSTIATMYPRLRSHGKRLQVPCSSYWVATLSWGSLMHRVLLILSMPNLDHLSVSSVARAEFVNRSPYHLMNEGVNQITLTTTQKIPRRIEHLPLIAEWMLQQLWEVVKGICSAQEKDFWIGHFKRLREHQVLKWISLKKRDTIVHILIHQCLIQIITTNLTVFLKLFGFKRSSDLHIHPSWLFRVFYHRKILLYLSRRSVHVLGHRHMLTNPAFFQVVVRTAPKPQKK